MIEKSNMIFKKNFIYFLTRGYFRYSTELHVFFWRVLVHALPLKKTDP